ncbi:MAG: Dabb family protein [Verrucomicrobia bacterium]|nr:Dabb family protein [Verrucomicrobiota bacterium]
MTPKIIAALSLLLLASCATIAPPAKTGSVDHVVLVWLKSPGSEKDRKALLAQGNDLRAIPGIHFLDSGTALPSERPTVDDSFDIAYVMRFESPAALEAYAVHPIHVKAKDTLLALSRKVLVYDIRSNTK